MSRESMPILSGVIPSFEGFMTKWEMLAEHPRLKALIKPGLDLAYKYYSRMDNTKAYVVSMCKLKFLLFWLKLIFNCSSEPRHTHELGQETLG
jgi:hypothetical protein